MGKSEILVIISNLEAKVFSNLVSLDLLTPVKTWDQGAEGKPTVHLTRTFTSSTLDEARTCIVRIRKERHSSLGTRVEYRGQLMKQISHRAPSASPSCPQQASVTPLRCLGEQRIRTPSAEKLPRNCPNY